MIVFVNYDNSDAFVELPWMSFSQSGPLLLVHVDQHEASLPNHRKPVLDVPLKEIYFEVLELVQELLGMEITNRTKLLSRAQKASVGRHHMSVGTKALEGFVTGGGGGPIPYR